MCNLDNGGILLKGTHDNLNLPSNDHSYRLQLGPHEGWLVDVPVGG